VLYDSDQPAVAVSLFFIVRPDPQKVHPEYLTWFLNSSIAQSYFQERRLGISVGNIRKDALESLEIQLPNLEKQKQVAKLNKLM
jgi:restriction endonuclease S subunit